MKVNELMVGDWVYVSGKPVKITKDDLATMLIFLDDDSKINPIPLTEEILVKNGFEDVSEEGDRIRLLGTFDENDNITFVNLYPATIGYGTDITQLKVYYIHQLQHLLRMCGIEKELTI